jgi:hypothetical protein
MKEETEPETETGYVYCFSNPSMEGILKIGMTERTPDIRLKEANTPDTWKPPLPYICEIAKKVYNPKEKESIIHKLLSQYTERINPRREFFRVSIEEVKTFFDLMDGELWEIKEKDHQDHQDKEDEQNEEEDDEEQVEDENEEHHKQHKIISGKLCRDMSLCFADGQRIRHNSGNDNYWFGIYNSSKNGIIHNNRFYKSLSGFAETHYSIDRPDRVKSANGWRECECEINGKWVYTYNLKSIT